MKSYNITIAVTLLLLMGCASSQTRPNLTAKLSPLEAVRNELSFKGEIRTDKIIVVSALDVSAKDCKKDTYKSRPIAAGSPPNLARRLERRRSRPRRSLGRVRSASRPRP